MHNLNEIAAKTLAALKENGAEKAACTARFTETHEFNVDGGEFSLFRTLFDNNLSMTAICGKKKGSVGINRFDDEAIAKAASDCAAIAASGAPDEAWDFADGTDHAPTTDGCPEADLDRFFDRTRELMDDIKQRHPKILMEQMIVTHKKIHCVYMNSKGVSFDTTEGYYAIDLMFSAHEGNKASSFFGTGVITDSLDTRFIDLGSIETDLADVEKQLDPVPLTGKFTGTALFPAGSLGSILYSVVGNFASDMTILDGTSPWKDKLGTAVADERLTVSLNPSDSRVVCGDRYTADGFEAEDYDLIKDGVLESFMLSLYVSNKTGIARAKNSSGSMIVKPGDTPLADIIAGIERGIIVGRFSGGDPGTGGDFSGVAKNSFLIENGKITCALSETMISGNIGDLLKNIRAISKETVADGSTVLPAIAFDGVTVSGQ